MLSLQWEEETEQMGKAEKGLSKDKGPWAGKTHTGWAAAQSIAHCSVSQKTDLATDLEF